MPWAPDLMWNSYRWYITKASGKMSVALYSSSKYLAPLLYAKLTRARSDQKQDIVTISGLELPTFHVPVLSSKALKQHCEQGIIFHATTSFSIVESSQNSRYPIAIFMFSQAIYLGLTSSNLCSWKVMPRMQEWIVVIPFVFHWYGIRREWGHMDSFFSRIAAIRTYSRQYSIFYTYHKADSVEHLLI